MTNCCDTPRPDNLYLCPTHAGRLSDDLDEYPWLMHQLEVTMRREQGVDYRTLATGSSSSSEAPSPVDVGALYARQNLVAVLALWRAKCADAGVLVMHVPGLARMSWSPEMQRDVSRSAARARDVIDGPRDKWYAGDCDCGHTLYARVDEGDVTCNQCELVFDIGERRAWLLSAAEFEDAHPRQIARALSWLGGPPVNEDRIYKWVERGKLVATGVREGRPVYRVGDVLALLYPERSR